MNAIDVPILRDRLIEISEALNGKPPTPAGLSLWINTLREFALPDVADVLAGWAKRNTKMPAPADIWKACNEKRTDRIEQDAKVDKVRFQKESDAAFKRTDKGSKAIRELLARVLDQPTLDPREWAHVLWQRYIGDRKNDDGSAMSEAQIHLACQALRRTRQEAKDARDEYRSVK